MRNLRAGVALALAVQALLLGGCGGDPNVKKNPVPSAEKLLAADCAPAEEVYRKLLQLPPSAGTVIHGRSRPARSEGAQARAAESFGTQCQTALVGQIRRIVTRCWSDAPDAETFQSCSQRF